MRPVTIFTGTTGLNTFADPARLYSSKNGVQDLQAAADIEISDTGRISRRKGYTLRNAAAAHSLFCDGGDCLFVAGTSLCVLAADYSHKAIATVTQGARVGCCQVNDEIFWCNGHEKGRVKDATALSWVKGDYVGPTTNRVLSNPPVGTHVAYYNGRLYVSQGNTMWISEPFAFGAFDLARGFIPFASNIRMIRAVDGGLFVSTDRRVWFLHGTGPGDFQRTLVTDYPAIEWSDAKFEGSLVFNKDGGFSITKGGDRAVMWMSEKGICYGGRDGRFLNLTEDKIQSVPSGLTGSGLVHRGRYIGLIDP